MVHVIDTLLPWDGNAEMVQLALASWQSGDIVDADEDDSEDDNQLEYENLDIEDLRVGISCFGLSARLASGFSLL